LSAVRNRGTIGVIDIFAGPGGLGEGFSSFMSSGRYPFELAVSAEMEKSAHQTLQLRAFLRLLMQHEGRTPRDYFAYCEQIADGGTVLPSAWFGDGKRSRLWKQAEQQALNLTLGNESDNVALYRRIHEVRRKFSEIILVGGPPCQAYSLVGRARRTNEEEFRTKGVPRHFLYKQYLRILADFKPALFIMENVKGLLTSTVGGDAMLAAIMRDLENPAVAVGDASATRAARSRYTLLPVHVAAGEDRTHDLVAEDPGRFVIRCERHGVPQARHRVVIMGVRDDLMNPGVAKVEGLQSADEVTIERALTGLPKLRSGLSRQPDDPLSWLYAVESERARLVKVLRRVEPEVAETIRSLVPGHHLPRCSCRYTRAANTFVGALRSTDQHVVLNHETRSHMRDDLARYVYCAAYASVHNQSPPGDVFPWELAPHHLSWGTGAFTDRFRVQLRNRPASTITSHLSKDGHAFIHWDPAQCRSLTVREAARLQTFPDDYLFVGNRTQQYIQVGNAVPPLVARQIAQVVWGVLNATRFETKGRPTLRSTGAVTNEGGNNDSTGREIRAIDQGEAADLRLTQSGS
jgi:DNA (cytosine-5)-methyltransferase 1